MIFMLIVLVPVVGFYAYVFVNFARELTEIRRRKFLGAVTIPLQIQTCRDDEPEQSSIAVVEVARHAAEASATPRRPDVDPLIALRQWSSHEIYQLESPYLGPLFLVPRGRRSVDRGARMAHARLVSAMCGTAPGAANPKRAVDCSTLDSDHGNVIQITSRVAAHG